MNDWTESDILKQKQTMSDKMQSLQGITSREKFWSELDADGRVERLRHIVKRNRNDIDTLTMRVRKLEDQLERHEHSPASGKSVLTIHNPNAWQSESSGHCRSDNEGDDCYI